MRYIDMQTKTIIRILGAALVLLAAPALWAQSAKATAVMAELARYHESLVADPGKPIGTAELVTLLRGGGDSAKLTRLFKAAIPAAVELGKSGDATSRLDAYARLVDALAPAHGSNDKSGTHVFYCPMVKKKWIARGEAVRNPYMPEMRKCGTKRSQGHG